MNLSPVRRSFSGAAVVAALGMFGCGSDSSGKPTSTGLLEAGTDGGGDSGANPDACVPDESAPVPADRCTEESTDTSLPPCEQWVKVEVPGTVCGDGSQYKFFVNYTKKSNDLVVSFEPGGACWDYESCSGKGGIRGAANPNGIPDNHMDTYQYLNLLNRADTNPMKKWNMVFLSYCTGDVHTGNNVITYTGKSSGDGGKTDAAAGASASDGGVESLVFHHAGHANTMAVIEWMNSHFKTIPKMLVTGCSAGGAGAIINYHFVRQGMKGAQCGYLLDDSGPIFHSDGKSKPLHEKIRSSWNVDPILDELGADFPVAPSKIREDFGLLNEALAKKYPKDRLSLVLYRMDLNYSLYSYQRFYPNPSEADIHEWWWDDIQGLIKTYDTYPNLSYYIPYFRSDNCSHCVSIPPLGHLDVALTQPWLGSEIQQDHLTLQDFSTTLVDDTKPLKSYLEDVQASESFTPEESATCMEGG